MMQPQDNVNGMQNGRVPEMAPFQIIFYKLEKNI